VVLVSPPQALGQNVRAYFDADNKELVTKKHVTGLVHTPSFLASDPLLHG
jgi:hypothetical protein